MAKWFKRFLNEANYTLMGHRAREIRLDLDEIKGSIQALKLDNFIRGCANPAVKADIAIVSCLPPDETGIARFSEVHLAEFEGDIDIYTEIQDIKKIVNSLETLGSKKSNYNIYSVDSLLLNNRGQKYKHVIFVIGNSDHNVVLLHHLQAFVSVYGPESVYCFLHDPVCFNVTRKALALNDDQYIALVQQLHKIDLSQSLAEHSYIYDAMLANNIRGARIISNVMKVDKFIVNSAAARDLIAEDCGSAVKRIGVLFHPVFELEYEGPSQRPTDTDLVVGTYGCPSNAKMTDVVIAACSKLVSEGMKIRLIIAGYNSHEYASRHFGGTIPTWVSLSFPPTESIFQMEMAKCDIGVQLRKRNLGESSGVIPTLLKMGKTVIASKIGAFADYGDSVLYFDGGAAELADLLKRRPMVDEHKIESYVTAHSVAVFNSKLSQFLNESYDQAPSPSIQPVRREFEPTIVRRD